jgi:hypothetical protein
MAKEPIKVVDERTEFSLKVSSFKNSEHWKIFEDRLKSDWKKLNVELRTAAVEGQPTWVVAGKIAYIQEIMTWYSVMAQDSLRVEEENNLIEASNDY